MKSICFLAIALALAGGFSVQAASVESVDLEPLRHVAATLTVVDTAGNETVYTPADIEALGTYRMVTTTPWRTDQTVFEGGLLQDILKKHGLDGVEAIRVVAENEFESILENAVWEAAPILLATRVEGRPHSRRARGPIQFVVSMDDYEASTAIEERHLVWMAARIEPIQ